MENKHKKGQHLFTKDGRKIGNGIVAEVQVDNGKALYKVETDFGNLVGPLNETEIDHYWYTRKDKDPKITSVDAWRDEKHQTVRDSYAMDRNILKHRWWQYACKQALMFFIVGSTFMGAAHASIAAELTISIAQAVICIVAAIAAERMKTPEKID